VEEENPKTHPNPLVKVQIEIENSTPLITKETPLGVLAPHEKVLEVEKKDS